jgi:hypothetical protein
MVPDIAVQIGGSPVIPREGVESLYNLLKPVSHSPR